MTVCLLNFGNACKEETLSPEPRMAGSVRGELCGEKDGVCVQALRLLPQQEQVREVRGEKTSSQMEEGMTAPGPGLEPGARGVSLAMASERDDGSYGVCERVRLR